MYGEEEKYSAHTSNWKINGIYSRPTPVDPYYKLSIVQLSFYAHCFGRSLPFYGQKNQGMFHFFIYFDPACVKVTLFLRPQIFGNK